MINLYLHGLNSTNVNDRTAWLQQYGKLFHPLVSYKNLPATFQYLDHLVRRYRPQVIIGSSMGGYMAFHLGQYYHIPTILLNPALIMTNIIKPDNRLMAGDSMHHISIGIKDEIIPPVTTKLLLNKWQIPHKIYEYDMGHETPIETFKEVCLKSGLFKKIF